MEEIGFGVVLGAVAAAVLWATLTLGGLSRAIDITEQCQHFGKFVAGQTTYTCTADKK